MTKLMGETAAPESSPCRKVCRLLQAHPTVCAGCGRTLDEIRRWPEMTDNERLLVKKRAAKRLLESRN